MGSFEATETSVLGEKVMNSRKTVHESILFFDMNLVHKCIHVLTCFGTSYIFYFLSMLSLCVCDTPFLLF